MFSLSDMPVQIDGISLAEMGPAGAFSRFDSEATDFSKVLGELQQPEGEISLEQLSENPEMLKDLGLSSDHLKMLQQLLADGKSLPEAAQTVLFDLKQQLAELLREEPSLQQIEQIETLQEEVVDLLKLFPEDLSVVIENELQALRRMIEPLKQELETLARQEIPEQIKNSAQDNSNPADSDDDSDIGHQVAVETTQNKETVSESALLAAAVVNPGQQDSQAVTRNSDQTTKVNATAAVQASVNKSSQGKAAAFMNKENATADGEYDLHSEAKPQVENKLMPSLTSQQASSRVAHLQMNDQAMSQAMTKFSGQGAGSGNLQSGGNNASYTQLMTQSMPSPVTQNIHKPEWGNAIGQRITWMIGNKLQGAQLRISPAHLGPVDIKLSIESGVAQVSFVSNHQVVRDALEQAVPRLRDMLENQNLELGDVDISDRGLADSPRMQDEFAHSHDHGHAQDNAAQSEADTDDQAVAHVLHSDTLLDAYA